MRKLIFLSCLIVLTAAAYIAPRERLPAAEPPPVKTGEETKMPAVAPEPAGWHVSPPQSLHAEREAFVPPQEAPETETSDEPGEPAEQPPEAALPQPLAQPEPATPSAVLPRTSANPSSTPQSGDKRTVDGQAEIWIPGFGWIPDNGGGSVGTIATSDGDINKIVGTMGGGDPPRREQAPPSESYVPHVGDVRVDLQTGIQEVLTEDGWAAQDFGIE